MKENIKLRYFNFELILWTDDAMLGNLKNHKSMTTNEFYV